MVTGTQQGVDALLRDAEARADALPGEETPSLAIEGVQISGPGWVTLWETRTGEERRVNKNNLVAALLKKHKDPAFPQLKGTPVFSKTPVAHPPLGQFTCLLHESRPEHGHYVSMGFRPCSTAHIPSEYEVTQHMAKRHRAEWLAIKAEREEAQRKEDRDLQRQSLAALTKAAARGPEKATRKRRAS